MAKEFGAVSALRVPARRVAVSSGECTWGAFYCLTLRRAGERRGLVNSFVRLATEPDAGTKSGRGLTGGELRSLPTASVNPGERLLPPAGPPRMFQSISAIESIARERIWATSARIA